MDEKQKCQMCDSLLARTFIDYKGKRIFLCQQDANAVLRVAAINTPDTFSTAFKFLETLTYGKEDSILDNKPKQEEHDTNKERTATTS